MMYICVCAAFQGTNIQTNKQTICNVLQPWHDILRHRPVILHACSTLRLLHSQVTNMLTVSTLRPCHVKSLHAQSCFKFILSPLRGAGKEVGGGCGYSCPVLRQLYTQHQGLVWPCSAKHLYVCRHGHAWPVCEALRPENGAPI